LWDIAVRRRYGIVGREPQNSYACPWLGCNPAAIPKTTLVYIDCYRGRISERAILSATMARVLIVRVADGVESGFASSLGSLCSAERTQNWKTGTASIIVASR
jgi:hypothetical protein